jgi:uncharacterized membrane protein
MSRTATSTVSQEAHRPRALGSASRALTLALATLTTGLVAGVFYAYSVSVDLGLAAQPDESYVATMQAINERIQNPLVALACALYIGGGFLLTAFVNVPMNEQLAGVAADASSGELASARDAYEGSWDFWNGVRAVLSSLAFLVLIGACLLREDRGV